MVVKWDEVCINTKRKKKKKGLSANNGSWASRFLRMGEDITSYKQGGGLG